MPACSSNVAVRTKPTTGPYDQNAARELKVPSEVVSVGATSTLWATGSLYNDSYKQLRACPLATACTAPTEIDTDAAAVSALTYFDGKHYGATSAGAVFSVSDASPGARTPLVSDAAGITDVAVDASGIYWVNGTTGKVLAARRSRDVWAAARRSRRGRRAASRIRLDAQYVYWMTTTTVMKVAK